MIDILRCSLRRMSIRTLATESSHPSPWVPLPSLLPPLAVSLSAPFPRSFTLQTLSVLTTLSNLLFFAFQSPWCHHERPPGVHPRHGRGPRPARGSPGPFHGAALQPPPPQAPRGRLPPRFQRAGTIDTPRKNTRTQAYDITPRAIPVDPLSPRGWRRSLPPPRPTMMIRSHVTCTE